MFTIYLVITEKNRLNDTLEISMPLICTFVFRMQQNQDFSRGPSSIFLISSHRDWYVPTCALINNSKIHARIQRGWGQGSGFPPLKNPKYIGFLSNIGRDPLNNHKIILNIKLAFNIWPSSTDEDPLLVLLGSSHPS